MPKRALRFILSRRVRRWALGSALAVVGVSCALILTVVIMARGTPSWWRAVPRDDPGTAETARRFEDGITNSLYLVRPTDPAFVPSHPGEWRSETWTIRVNAAEVNAWLNTRFEPWLTHIDKTFTWPEDLSEVQLSAGPEGIRLGARLWLGGRERIVSASVEPLVRADGSLRLPARRVGLGRLSIPADWVLDLSDPAAGGYVPVDLRGHPETGSVMRAFLGEGPVVKDAVIKLGDGRGVRILGITPQDGALVLTCRTEIQ